jgi:hypothetical protein
MSGTIHDTSTWAGGPNPKRWIVRYRIGGRHGRQYSRSFAERPDAEQFLASLEPGCAPPRPPCTYCGAPLPSGRRRFCSPVCQRRGIAAERKAGTETADVGKFVIDMIRSLARRVGGSDIAEFGALWEVQAAAERAVTGAITDLRSAGFTWEELGAEIGVSRQAAQQWHKRRLADADTGGQASAESAVNESLTGGAEAL